MENKKIRLLAVQMESVLGDVDLNIKTVRNLLCENIEKYGEVDFVFLPEVWTVGWRCQSFPDSATTLDESLAVKMLKEIAKKYKTNIFGGSFIRKENGKLYNTCPVIDRNGNLICKYDKNHLYSYLGDTENLYIEKGSSPVLVNIEGIQIGISICYDIRFPEIYRAYRKAGADILVDMAAWPKSRRNHWDTLTKARAIENQSYFVALTQTGLLDNGVENLGHSMIIDYEGNVMTQIEEKEGAVYAEFDLESMYKYRNECTILKDIRASYEVECV